MEDRGQVLRLYELGLVSAKAAIAQLKVDRSTFYRQLKKYKSEGLVALRHGNSGKEPVNKLDPEVKQRIEHLLLTRYAGFQPALVKKYLAQEDGISVSEEYIRRLLKRNGREAQRQKQQLHQSRRRRSRFGELIQVDGSPHHWFGPDQPPCCLLAFSDDATSKITAARFYQSETSTGYLELIKDHVLKYGIPVSLYSDQHSIFTTSKESNKGKVRTQYQRCCEALGIESILAKTPQAKGRIERLNRTLQGRWVKEFALLGIKTIEEANDVIGAFIEQYNAEFGVPPMDSEDAHVKLADKEQRQAVERICAKWVERKLSKTLSCNYDDSVIQVQGVENKWTMVGKTVHVIGYPDGHLEVVYENKLMPFIRRERKTLECFEQYEETPKTIDSRIDQIMAKENNRRAAWLEKRRVAAAKSLDTKEEVITAAEEIVKKRPHK